MRTSNYIERAIPPGQTADFRLAAKRFLRKAMDASGDPDAASD
jgi:hypothetical protein